MRTASEVLPFSVVLLVAVSACGGRSVDPGSTGAGDEPGSLPDTGGVGTQGGVSQGGSAHGGVSQGGSAHGGVSQGGASGGVGAQSGGNAGGTGNDAGAPDTAGAGGSSSCNRPDACDDGDVCTEDICSGVSCKHLEVKVDDQNACTVDGCVGGTIVHMQLPVSDGNACTADTCDPIFGIAHAAVNVDDKDPCTVDACDPAKGISHVKVDIDDGDGCTLDACSPITGVSHKAINVDDADACTVDKCDSLNGITHQPVVVDDKNACTVDTCTKAQGVSHTQLVCRDENGCAIATCDPVVGCKVGGVANLAPQAKAIISSGGSQQGYAPTELNNGITEASDCKRFSWIDNASSPQGAFFELDWPSAVSIGALHVETAPAGGDSCNLPGRNLSSATIQYWNGTSWVTATSFSGQTDDIDITLPSPVTTSKLRLFDVTTTPPGNGNSLIYELYVFPSANCGP